MPCAKCAHLEAQYEILKRQRAKFAAEYKAALASQKGGEISQLKQAVKESDRLLRLCKERIATHAVTHV
jgi:hypothetical protein